VVTSSNNNANEGSVLYNLLVVKILLTVVIATITATNLSELFGDEMMKQRIM